MSLVWVRFKSDRQTADPAGTWSAGEEREVDDDFARHLVEESGTAELARGASIPPRATPSATASGSLETAALEGGTLPAGELPPGGARARERGRS